MISRERFLFTVLISALIWDVFFKIICAFFHADPNFVSSFLHDGMVYFFFRETAVENINCGKVRWWMLLIKHLK